MLTWARAFLAARAATKQLLAPQWFQPRLGAILRREPVTRFYAGEFTNRGYVRGFRRFLILKSATKIRESEHEARLFSAPNPRAKNCVVVFEGLGDYFSPLIPHRQMIHHEILRIANPMAVRRAHATSTPYIVANVRRGDMTRQKMATSKILQYTPDDWFIAAITAIRTDVRWKHLPIKIVSDGSAAELAEIVALPRCQFVTTHSAVGDILLMSRAELLLASGYSTFSMWASFLGQMPTLYYPGRMQQKLFSCDVRSFEGEWEPGVALPDPSKSTQSLSVEQ